MNSHHADTDLHSNDLTQLSSREQLSALMDGALPADQTRFLLRRLQHDGSLAASWERWRIAGETLRGLAPAQRLPVDFAGRVGAALRGDAVQPAAPAVVAARTPAWLRRGGGVAMAASLAMVAWLAVRPAGAPDGAVATSPVAAVAPAPVSQQPASPQTPNPPPAAGIESQAALVAAAAVAARPATRERTTPAPPRAARRAPVVQVAQVAPAKPAVATTLPDAIVTRPWPRAVLPQYAQGGLAVGLGGGPAGEPMHNPFQQPRLAMVPAFEPPAAGSGAADAADEAPPAADPR